MKTALVTGGGKGLGKGFVDYFLSQGFLVFSGVRNPSEEKSSKDNLRIIPLDVSDESSITRAFELVSKETDHLDFLINNAGVNKDTATGDHKEIVCNLPDLSREALLKMFNVNAVSPVMVLQNFLPLLKNAQSFVVNISSGRASYRDEFSNASGNYGYRASKAALNLMTFSSLFDLPENVKTFAVHPGNVKSEMNPGGSDLPEEQAEKIIAITDHWKNEFNGKFLRFDGTLYPL